MIETRTVGDAANPIPDHVRSLIEVVNEDIPQRDRRREIRERIEPISGAIRTLISREPNRAGRSFRARGASRPGGSRRSIRAGGAGRTLRTRRARRASWSNRASCSRRPRGSRASRSAGRSRRARGSRGAGWTGWTRRTSRASRTRRAGGAAGVALKPLRTGGTRRTGRAGISLRTRRTRRTRWTRNGACRARRAGGAGGASRTGGAGWTRDLYTVTSRRTLRTNRARRTNGAARGRLRKHFLKGVKLVKVAAMQIRDVGRRHRICVIGFVFRFADRRSVDLLQINLPISRKGKSSLNPHQTLRVWRGEAPESFFGKSNPHRG